MNKCELVDDNWRVSLVSVKTLLHALNNIGNNWRYEIQKIDIGGGWIFEMEERHGGIEGAGEDHWVIISFSHNGRGKTFWSVPGWYSSYEGSDVDINNTYEVKPGEKVVRVWNKV